MWPWIFSVYLRLPGRFATTISLLDNSFSSITPSQGLISLMVCGLISALLLSSMILSRIDSCQSPRYFTFLLHIVLYQCMMIGFILGTVFGDSGLTVLLWALIVIFWLYSSTSACVFLHSLHYQCLFSDLICCSCIINLKCHSRPVCGKFSFSMSALYMEYRSVVSTTACDTPACE